MSTSIWEELLENLQESFDYSIEKLKDNDIETIPGARDNLITKFDQLKMFLPEKNGQLLTSIIENSIQNTFFPNLGSLADNFIKILNSRTPEQDSIIKELINGFVTSQGKVLASNKEGPILDHLVEAFKKRIDFRILDYQFYAMFGDPAKPRKYVLDNLKKIVDFLGLENEEVIVEKDVRDSNEKTYIYYFFPEEIKIILEDKYIEVNEGGEKIISENFDKMVFISYFLANLSVSRKTLDSYSINGICAIFSLILLISFMPKIQISETNPILRDSHFNNSSMSVIPKSWMSKEVLSIILPSLIRIIAYRLGGLGWLDQIATTENKKKIHMQAQFLLRDVNKWVLGNMCRVEIPIFVEISNIINEIILTTDESDR